MDKALIKANLYRIRFIANHDERIDFVRLVDKLRLLDSQEFDSNFFGLISEVFDDSCHSYETMQELHTFLEQKYYYQRTLTEFWSNLKNWYIKYQQAKNWYGYYLLSIYNNPVIQVDTQVEITNQSDLGEFLNSIVTTIGQDLA